MFVFVIVLFWILSPNMPFFKTGFNQGHSVNLRNETRDLFFKNFFFYNSLYIKYFVDDEKNGWFDDIKIVMLWIAWTAWKINLFHIMI